MSTSNRRIPRTWFLFVLAVAAVHVPGINGSLVSRAAESVQFTHGPILGHLTASGVGVWAARISNPGSTLHLHWGAKPVDGDPNAGVYEIIDILDRNRLRIRPPARAESNSVYSIGRHSYWRMRVANRGFFFLDTRSQQVLHVRSNPRKAGLSMLGRCQKRWLMDCMCESNTKGTTVTRHDFMCFWATFMAACFASAPVSSAETARQILDATDVSGGLVVHVLCFTGKSP